MTVQWLNDEDVRAICLQEGLAYLQSEPEQPVFRFVPGAGAASFSLAGQERDSDAALLKELRGCLENLLAEPQTIRDLTRSEQPVTLTVTLALTGASVGFGFGESLPKASGRDLVVSALSLVDARLAER